MLHGLDGLRLDPVVRGHDQDHDISHPGTAGTHRRESRVTRCIEKRDHAAIGLNMVGTDVLSDAARLTLGDTGSPDVVEQ